MNNFVETTFITKYMTVPEITYEVLVSLHYDIITCANEARRVEWYGLNHGYIM